MFTFAWSPRHYLHLMFITFIATVVGVGLSRWMAAPEAAAEPVP